MQRLRFKHSDLDGIVHLEIDGALDAGTVIDLRPALEALLTAKPTQIEVKLAGLELIDSSGVAAIVSLYKRAREYGGQVKLNGVCGQPLTVFKVLRLDRVFSL